MYLKDNRGNIHFYPNFNTFWKDHVLSYDIKNKKCTNCDRVWKHIIVKTDIMIKQTLTIHGTLDVGENTTIVCHDIIFK